MTTIPYPPAAGPTKEIEEVLVFPSQVLTDLGDFTGFNTDLERYMPHLLNPAHLRFLPREQAEHDPSYKQLVCYVVVSWGDNIFCYKRGKEGGEARLHAKRSLGIGGHINPVDGTADYAATYTRGVQRELAEELYLPAAYTERLIGMVHDPRTPVGQVHFGLVHRLQVATAEVRPRDPALVEAAFLPLAQLRRERDHFETWSAFTLDYL